MDWFSILKNQVASTKGKTFSLDFSQPMVEEDDSCMQKLLDLAKRGRIFSKEGYDTHSYVNPNFDKTVSEEECCVAINSFKVVREGEGTWAYNYQKQKLGAWKNNYRDYIGIQDDFGRYYVSAISMVTNYEVMLRRDVPVDATNEEIEKIGREFKEVSDRLFVL